MSKSIISNDGEVRISKPRYSYRILKDWNLKRQVEDNSEQDSSAKSLPA